jgi:poly-gamma-glutamate synthesis protein (capsule biosynthesis protein)
MTDPYGESKEAKMDDIVSIIVTGEILIHDRIVENALRADGSYDFNFVFDQLREEIAGADIRMANTEVIIGGEELGISGYPRFNIPYELADAIANAGFNVTLQASNHSLDRDGEGIRNCVNYWRRHHPNVRVVGIYDNKEDADRICSLRHNGIKIAILNYTQGTNEIGIPEDMPWCINLMSEDKVKKDIEEAKRRADFVIVCPHWGTEYSLSEDEYQKKWARMMAEWGADLIIGTHPHVFEPVVWIKDTLCAYSLGTFVNWTAAVSPEDEGVANRVIGTMLKAQLQRDKTTQRVKLISFELVPVVVHLSEEKQGVTVYRFSDYTEELAEKNAIIKQDEAFSIDYCKNLFCKVFGEKAAFLYNAPARRISRSG